MSLQNSKLVDDRPDDAVYVEAEKESRRPIQMSGSPKDSLVSLMQRIYVPVLSLLLALTAGNWLADTYAFDPLTAAQNERIRFQKEGDLSFGLLGITSEEAKLAEAVVENKTSNGDRAELLYVGNSQVLAIMDQRPGDIISPQWLQILLARQHVGSARQIDVRLAAFPNITLTELLIKLVSAGEQSPRHPDILLVGAVLEEFRGLGVRDEIAAALESPLARSGLIALVEGNADLPAARKALEPFLSSTAKPSPAEGAGDVSAGSLAHTVERRLQAAAEKTPLFAKRQNLQVALNLSYNAWRDRLLGITSTAARPVPAAAYKASLELLEMTLRYAKSRSIRTAVYLAPMRLGVQPNPNVPADVDRFRRDIPDLCQRYDLPCLDYVDLVPESLWTNYSDTGGMASQRDFAHFTGAAHKLLAERLAGDLNAALHKPEEKRSAQP